MAGTETFKGTKESILSRFLPKTQYADTGEMAGASRHGYYHGYGASRLRFDGLALRLARIYSYRIQETQAS